MPNTRRIGLFGGSFDPVHRGHLHLAQTAREALDLTEVRFLPCQVSPHKTGSAPAAAADRLAMLQLATAGLPWAVVDDLELNRDGPSFSYQTAEEMRRRFPAARLFWILGGDQWDALPTWRHPQRLAAAVEFIVMPRHNQQPQPRNGMTLHIVHAAHPASSTALRAALAAGAIHHPWLTPETAAWIAKHAIYQPSSG